MSTIAQPDLREVSRRAVRDRIASIAIELFTASGYDATTTDEIAAAAGTSQRTLFRYFPTKDAIALAPLARTSEAMIELLESGEPSGDRWEVLRGLLEISVQAHSDPARRAEIIAAWSVVENTPALLGANLRRLDDAQQRIASLLTGPEPSEEAAIETRALVGMAFACLQAALRSTRGAGGVELLGARLDGLMTRLRPLPR